MASSASSPKLQMPQPPPAGILPASGEACLPLKRLPDDLNRQLDGNLCPKWNDMGTQNSWSVRDVVDASNTVSTTFGGDHLIVNTNDQFKRQGDRRVHPDSQSRPQWRHARRNTVTNANQSTTLAGSVAFGTTSTMGVVGALSPCQLLITSTLNFSSTTIGAEGNTLQLTMNGGATRTVLFNVISDLSNFSERSCGGFSAGVAPGVSSSSAFAITSSALSATLQLDTTTTNFHYNLGNSNVPSGALGSGNGTRHCGRLP